MGAGKAVVLLSGGLDSAACAHMLAKSNAHTSAIFIDYGQRAGEAEACAAAAVASYLGIEFKVISLTPATSHGAGELTGRNAFFILAALLVMKGNVNLIALGVHAGTPYYDCSSQFIDEMSRLVAHHTDGRVKVFAPFIEWRKIDIYDYFLNTKIPISLTYSCENGIKPPCGICPSCKDREVLGC